MTASKKNIRGKKLADLIAASALTKKADYIALVQITGSVGIADWFVICQGDNPAHNRAIADAIVDDLKEKKVAPWHMEGERDSRWILLDYSDVVVHVMLPDLREYYALEELWPGAVVLAYHGDGADE